MWFGVITLFPEMFSALTDQGVVGRAFKNGQAQLSLWNPRDFTEDKHRTVDDRPYGGGPGMLMKVEPLARAIEAAKQASIEVTGDVPAKVIYLSPQGRVVNQALIAESTQEQALILICGRYEGIDERLIETLVDEEWSVGDFVLSGGELPAMSVIDAMVRLLPGVLGHDDSAIEDSFTNGRLDWPQYTRPEILDGREVPKVLLSGDHQAIARWRNEQALLKTLEKRPELIDKDRLTPDERNLLDVHTADKEIDD